MLILQIYKKIYTFAHYKRVEVLNKKSYIKHATDGFCFKPFVINVLPSPIPNYDWLKLYPENNLRFYLTLLTRYASCFAMVYCAF